MRLEAWKTASAAIAQHPLTGVGPGDVNIAMQAQYEAEGSVLWEENRIPPHNQFLENMLASGIAGHAGFCCAAVRHGLPSGVAWGCPRLHHALPC